MPKNQPRKDQNSKKRRAKKSESDLSEQHSSPSRRNFLMGGSMMLAGSAIAGGNLSVARGAHAFGSDLIKIGLVGCNGLEKN